MSVFFLPLKSNLNILKYVVVKCDRIEKPKSSVGRSCAEIAKLERESKRENEKEKNSATTSLMGCFQGAYKKE